MVGMPNSRFDRNELGRVCQDSLATKDAEKAPHHRERARKTSQENAEERKHGVHEAQPNQAGRRVNPHLARPQPYSQCKSSLRGLTSAAAGS